MPSLADQTNARPLQPCTYTQLGDLLAQLSRQSGGALRVRRFRVAAAGVPRFV